MREAGQGHDLVERLRAGHAPTASDGDLGLVLQEIRTSASFTRLDDSMPTELARIARTAHAGVIPARARTGGRLVVLAATVGLLVALAGVAMAADGAYPGQLLYPIDVAFEHIGIGAGGTAERLAEVDALVQEGREEEAEEHLASTLKNAVLPGGETAATTSEGAEIAEVVDEKGAFIDANKGKDNGLDGSEFGQGVAGLAPGHDETTPPGLVEDGETPAVGQDNVPPGLDPEREAPGNSENAGPPETEGPSEEGASTTNGNGQGNANGQTNGNGQGNGNANGQGNGNGNGGQPEQAGPKEK